MSKKKKRPGAGTAMDKAGGKDKDKSKKKQDEPPPPVENKYACVDLVSVPEPVEEWADLFYLLFLNIIWLW